MKICQKVIMTVEQTLLEIAFLHGGLATVSFCRVSDYKPWSDYRERTI